jgi:hypothetical protein
MYLSACGGGGGLSSCVAQVYSFFNFIVMQCCGLSVNIEPLLYVVGLAISIQNTIHYFLLQVC